MTFSSLEKDLHVAVEPALAGGNLEAVADVGEKGKFEELGRSVARLKDDRMVIASKFNHGVFRIDSSSAILLSFKAYWLLRVIVNDAVDANDVPLLDEGINLGQADLRF
ncbi:MAG: hypothetical protein HETSPECPRED_003817 [Heterodermia speciosa]|uniref:Uncharacterized protein n=1 Tax=Heterodermia speciosa TaxID=116794 RepID=A0A8H3IF90_9LECA|nr:MAG: hypothetical protein HETSPECPRED_003817 [Heterodermia speciosa]